MLCLADDGHSGATVSCPRSAAPKLSRARLLPTVATEGARGTNNPEIAWTGFISELKMLAAAIWLQEFSSSPSQPAIVGSLYASPLRRSLLQG